MFCAFIILACEIVKKLDFQLFANAENHTSNVRRLSFAFTSFIAYKYYIFKKGQTVVRNKII